MKTFLFKLLILVAVALALTSGLVLTKPWDGAVVIDDVTRNRR